jgi:hypothetical protein
MVLFLHAIRGRQRNGVIYARRRDLSGGRQWHGGVGFMDYGVLILVVGAVVACRCGRRRMVVSGFMDSDVVMLVMCAVVACHRLRWCHGDARLPNRRRGDMCDW